MVLPMVLLGRRPLLVGSDSRVRSCHVMSCQLTVVLLCDMQVTNYQMALAMESEVDRGADSAGPAGV